MSASSVPASIASTIDCMFEPAPDPRTPRCNLLMCKLYQIQRLLRRETTLSIAMDRHSTILHVAKLAVDPIRRIELVVGSTLDDLAVVHDEDQIGVVDRRKAMRYGERGAIRH